MNQTAEDTFNYPVKYESCMCSEGNFVTICPTCKNSRKVAVITEECDPDIIKICEKCNGYCNIYTTYGFDLCDECGGKGYIDWLDRVIKPEKKSVSANVYGMSGTYGVSGYSGTSGFCGSSGYTGTSGVCGVSGYTISGNIPVTSSYKTYYTYQTYFSCPPLFIPENDTNTGNCEKHKHEWPIFNGVLKWIEDKLFMGK